MNGGWIDENPFHWSIATGNIEGLGLDICVRVGGNFNTIFIF